MYVSIVKSFLSSDIVCIHHSVEEERRSPNELDYKIQVQTISAEFAGQRFFSIAGPQMFCSKLARCQNLVRFAAYSYCLLIGLSKIKVM